MTSSQPTEAGHVSYSRLADGFCLSGVGMGQFVGSIVEVSMTWPYEQTMKNQRKINKTNNNRGVAAWRGCGFQKHGDGNYAYTALYTNGFPDPFIRFRFLD